jgi:hypothetical protein
MAGTVKLFGHSFKTWQVWAVGIGGTGVAAFIYIKHRQNAAAASTASGTGATVTDPATGTAYPADGTDPLTGMTYSAEISEYGSVSAAEQAASQGASPGAADYGYGSSLGGTSYGPVGDYGTTLGVTSGTGYASNADWAQAVESGLTDIGYTSTDTASAVGRYLGGLSLTPDQQNIISVALAEYGPPPTGSYSIIAAPATTTAASGSTTAAASTAATGTTAATAPKAATATQASTVSAGHAVSVGNNAAVIAWSHAGPATSWKLTISGPGAINGHTATVGIAQGSYTGLEAGHTYDVTVQPLPTGTPGVITFKTTDAT